MQRNASQGQAASSLRIEFVQVPKRNSVHVGLELDGKRLSQKLKSHDQDEVYTLPLTAR